MFGIGNGFIGFILFPYCRCLRLPVTASLFHCNWMKCLPNKGNGLMLCVSLQQAILSQPPLLQRSPRSAWSSWPSVSGWRRATVTWFWGHSARRWLGTIWRSLSGSKTIWWVRWARRWRRAKESAASSSRCTSPDPNWRRRNRRNAEDPGDQNLPLKRRHNHNR